MATEGTMTMGTDQQPKRELYKFTPEELRVLKECSNESFYLRSLPIGSSFGFLAYYAVKSGYLKPSVKWGPWPKVAWAVTAGYFIGKFAYQGKCAEKLMALPNSPIAEALRQRKGKGGGFGPGFQEGFSTEQVIMSSNLQTEDEKNHHDNSIQEMRAEDRSYEAPPTAVGLDDNFRPSMDSFSVSEQELPPPTSNVTSYEDLRRKNREEYELKRMENYRRSSSPTPAAAPPVAQPPPPQRRVPSSTGGGQKNAYGDVWEE